MKYNLLNGKSKLNYQIDPYEKLQGRCPVCREGLDGCPRCYTIPIPDNETGPVCLDDYAFNPLKDRLLKKQSEKQKLNAKIKRCFNTSTSDDEVSVSVSDDDSVTTNSVICEKPGLYDDDPISKYGRFKIHTNLTIFTAIRMYRNLMVELLTVYIKVMPTGGVHKVCGLKSIFGTSFVTVVSPLSIMYDYGKYLKFKLYICNDWGPL